MNVGSKADGSVKEVVPFLHGHGPRSGLPARVADLGQVFARRARRSITSG